MAKTSAGKPQNAQPVAPAAVSGQPAIASKTATIVHRLIPVIVLVIVILGVWMIVATMKQDAGLAAERAFADNVYSLKKKYLKDTGAASEMDDTISVDDSWQYNQDRAGRIKGDETVLKQAVAGNPDFDSSRQATLLKWELANDYRIWAFDKQSTPSRTDTRNRLQKADDYFSDVVANLKPSELLYFQVVKTHADVKSDLASYMDTKENRIAKYREVEQYIGDQLKIAADTGRKVVEENYLHVLRGVVLYRLIELGEDIDPEDAINELDLNSYLDKYSILRDMAQDIIRRLEPADSITVTGKIDDAMETRDGNISFKLPTFPVLNDVMQFLMSKPPRIPPALLPPPTSQKPAGKVKTTPDGNADKRTNDAGKPPADTAGADHAPPAGAQKNPPADPAP